MVRPLNIKAKKKRKEITQFYFGTNCSEVHRGYAVYYLTVGVFL